MLDGKIQQSNFDGCPLPRIGDEAIVELHTIENHIWPMGVGEKLQGTIQPAIANALYQASGTRVRSIPIDLAKLEALNDDTPLLWLLRDELGLTGTKYVCGKGLCGACTVHLNGQAIRSCILPISAVKNKKVTSIEGENSAEIKALKNVWHKNNVPQCGYCQVGQLMSAAALLSDNSAPSEKEIMTQMSGNICRCGTYSIIKTGILDAAKELAKNVG